ncbi:MAG: hypothetical protein AAF447_24515 [Myxococcota bacterium]
MLRRSLPLAAWTVVALVGCEAEPPPDVVAPEPLPAAPAEPPAPPEPPPPPELKPDAEPRFGTLKIHPGFTPDPQTLSGDAGGPLEATVLAEACTGFVGEQPGHVVEADGSFAELRFLARPEADDAVGLVVRDPAGEAHCVGAPEAGSSVELAMPVHPGRHTIWVSARSAGLAPGYVLGVTELADVTLDPRGDADRE